MAFSSLFDARVDQGDKVRAKAIRLRLIRAVRMLSQLRKVTRVQHKSHLGVAATKMLV
jgi:hypothetical protein